MTDERLDTAEIDISADQPTSSIQLSGAHHITIIGSNEADTIDFYRDLLGMPLVLRQPNLDKPETTHLFFDPGDGRILTFFVRDDRQSKPDPLSSEIGSVHHLAFNIPSEQYSNVRDALDKAEHGFTEFDRGIARSIYTRDHNGLTLELTSDKYDIPSNRLGRVLATAHHHRRDEGAEYVQETHVESALADLGIDVERHDFSSLPNAPTGTGIQD